MGWDGMGWDATCAVPLLLPHKEEGHHARVAAVNLIHARADSAAAALAEALLELARAAAGGSRRDLLGAELLLLCTLILAVLVLHSAAEEGGKAEEDVALRREREVVHGSRGWSPQQKFSIAGRRTITELPEKTIDTLRRASRFKTTAGGPRVGTRHACCERHSTEPLRRPRRNLRRRGVVERCHVGCGRVACRAAPHLRGFIDALPVA
jgi:hypothetical protein